MRYYGSTVVFLPLLVILSAHPAAAQRLPSFGADEPLYIVPRLTGPVVLDGRIDEPAWEGIEPLPGVMYLPTFGVEPSERTEFRIAHDGDFLYFACGGFDSEPDGIQAVSLRRDAGTRSDDNCAIYLDTFNDEENALAFITTPTGRRIDQAIQNDAESGPNFDWNTFWDAAVSRDDRGWYAEMRIPFSSLFFQAEDGRVVMGMAMRRMIARKNEISTHPAMPPSLGPSSFRQPSLMRKIMLDGVDRPNPLYVTPYALGGWGHSHALSAQNGVYQRDSDRVAEVGLDVRYGLTSNLTLNVTVNTDFAQVEADDQQVNLSRFSLFFPEKRRFFQERSAIFEYPLGGPERLFHSRRVGLVESKPVRIYGGSRVVGRVGDWDVGLLSMQTGESELLPSENQSVLRLRRRVLNPNSYVGGIATSRLGSGGQHNIVYGLDGVFRVVGQEYLILNWAQSFDDREPTGEVGETDFLERTLLRLNWERRTQDGLNYHVDLTRAGRRFDPGLGFLRRRDYAKADLSLGHGWRPSAVSGLLTYALRMDAVLFRRNQDGIVETVEARPVAVVETRGRHLFTLSVPARYENLAASFTLLEGTSVPAGIHRFAAVQLQYQAPQGDLFRPGVALEGGQFFDGRQFSASFTPGWNPSMRFSLEGRLGLDYVEFPGRGQSFTAQVTRLQAEVMLSTMTSFLGFVQYNSTENALIANFRVHYNPREGNDLHIVWNESIVTDRHSFDPVRPLTTERTLLVKYSHTLQLEF